MHARRMEYLIKAKRLTPIQAASQPLPQYRPPQDARHVPGKLSVHFRAVIHTITEREWDYYTGLHQRPRAELSPKLFVLPTISPRLTKQPKPGSRRSASAESTAQTKSSPSFVEDIIEPKRAKSSAASASYSADAFTTPDRGTSARPARAGKKRARDQEDEAAGQYTEAEAEAVGPRAAKFIKTASGAAPVAAASKHAPGKAMDILFEESSGAASATPKLRASRAAALLTTEAGDSSRSNSRSTSRHRSVTRRLLL